MTAFVAALLLAVCCWLLASGPLSHRPSQHRGHASFLLCWCLESSAVWEIQLAGYSWSCLRCICHLQAVVFNLVRHSPSEDSRDSTSWVQRPGFTGVGVLSHLRDSRAIAQLELRGSSSGEGEEVCAERKLLDLASCGGSCSWVRWQSRMLQPPSARVATVAELGPHECPGC